MLSQSIWKREKWQLEEQASDISVLKKQITKEAEIDSSVQSSINEKIQTLKTNATSLAKKLENQKHKNAKLETIIAHMKGRMEQDRLQEASFRDNNNAENLNSLENRFKKLEYDLGQINGKVNRMSENLEQKKNKISHSRTERVIDSGIFRNIEKQLINSELTFKKLLIEKIKHQKEYDKLVHEYSLLKEKAESYYVRKDSTRSKTQKEVNLAEAEPEVTCKRKFLEVETTRNNHRSTTQHKVDEEIQQEEQKQVLVVKKLLLATRLDNCIDLLDYFARIEEINEKNFNELNIYADQSTEIEKYLKEAERLRSHKKNKFSNPHPLSRQHLASLDHHGRQQILQSTQQQLELENTHLTLLFKSESFQQLLSSLGIKPKQNSQDSFDWDLMVETMQAVDQGVSGLLRGPRVEEKTQGGRSGPVNDKLEEMMSKVRRNEECFKVMKKDDFKEEYNKLVKNMSQKSLVGRSANKKKSLPLIKK